MAPCVSSTLSSSPQTYKARIDNLNASARSLTDRLAVLDTRGPGRLASRIKWITPQNFPGNGGDGTMNLHGFDIRVDHNTDVLRVLLINHRPPFDPVTGEPLDPKVVGANSTIEQFQTTAGSDTMKHVRTYASEVIATPNSVTWVSDHAFVFTNDHGSRKVGLVCSPPHPFPPIHSSNSQIPQRRQLDPLLGGSNIGYCDRNRCSIASSGITFGGANGIIRGRDGLIYVAQTYTGKITVLSLDENHVLTEVDSFDTGLPLDNLTVDKEGDIFAAGFPVAWKWGESAKRPFEVDPPSAVFRVSREERGWSRKYMKRGEWHKGEYYVEKVLEDDGSVLPGATVAVHDAETGRFFLGGAVAPYITICETR
jgi:arylesterase/paraoxonase